mmetsp:Transcript_140830/g.450237  ORF Transcript_140830/g.450237 Transcript_140830/m.450237 type:complete len:502 (-) Transcript_140830:1618-3123(-)
MVLLLAQHQEVEGDNVVRGRDQPPAALHVDAEGKLHEAGRLRDTPHVAARRVPPCIHERRCQVDGAAPAGRRRRPRRRRRRRRRVSRSRGRRRRRSGWGSPNLRQRCRCGGGCSRGHGRQRSSGRGRSHGGHLCDERLHLLPHILGRGGGRCEARRGRGAGVPKVGLIEGVLEGIVVIVVAVVVIVPFACACQLLFGLLLLLPSFGPLATAACHDEFGELVDALVCKLVRPDPIERAFVVGQADDPFQWRRASSIQSAAIQRVGIANKPEHLHANPPPIPHQLLAFLPWILHDIRGDLPHATAEVDAPALTLPALGVHAHGTRGDPELLDARVVDPKQQLELDVVPIALRLSSTVCNSGLFHDAHGQQRAVVSLPAFFLTWKGNYVPFRRDLSAAAFSVPADLELHEPRSLGDVRHAAARELAPGIDQRRGQRERAVRRRRRCRRPACCSCSLWRHCGRRLRRTPSGRHRRGRNRCCCGGIGWLGPVLGSGCGSGFVLLLP